jgi:hypothetical protein
MTKATRLSRVFGLSYVLTTPGIGIEQAGDHVEDDVING